MKTGSSEEGVGRMYPPRIEVLIGSVAGIEECGAFIVDGKVGRKPSCAV